MPSLSPEDSKRITSLRFLLAVFVVFIHNRLDVETATHYHLAFDEPTFITYLKTFMTSTLGSAAVPLFFLFSGYLQFHKQDSYPVLLKKRLKSLVVPYVLWTLLAVLLLFVGQRIPQLSSFFQNEDNIVREWGLSDWLGIFWVHLQDGKNLPLVGQLWFVRDLIVLVIASPIIQFLTRRFPGAGLITAFLCLVNGLPLGFGTALFFYVIGFYAAEYNISLFTLADNISWGEYVLLLLGVLAVTIINTECAQAITLSSLGTIVSSLFFLKLSGAIAVNKNLFGRTEFLSEFSFFLYCIHIPFVLTVLNKISYRVIPLHGVWCLVQFVTPPLLCVMIALALGILLKKLSPPVFRVLNGGR